MSVFLRHPLLSAPFSAKSIILRPFPAAVSAALPRPCLPYYHQPSLDQLGDQETSARGWIRAPAASSYTQAVCGSLQRHPPHAVRPRCSPSCHVPLACHAGVQSRNNAVGAVMKWPELTGSGLTSPVSGRAARSWPGGDLSASSGVSRMTLKSAVWFSLISDTIDEVGSDFCAGVYRGTGVQCTEAYGEVFM